jgi:hypothetical protein
MLIAEEISIDAIPPAPVHCEAPVQDVVMTVNGAADEKSFAAVVSDVRNLDGGWTLISDDTLDSKRTFVLRARWNVAYDAVADAVFNATARG